MSAVEVEAAPVVAAADVPGRPVGFGFGFWCAAAWLAALLLAAATADLLPLPDPNASDYGALEWAPGFHRHVLGTDQLGRDTLARVVFGARVSLVVGAIAVLAALVIGGAIGVVAGYRRGWVERVVLVFCDALMAFPNVIVIIVIVTVAGASMVSLTIGLVSVFLPTFLRLARGAAMGVAPQDFVVAARASGATDRRILRRDVIPNIAWPVATYAVVAISTAIVAEGSLSFLGLGLRPPTASWGAMIAGGLDSLEDAPHISLTPAAMMCVTVLSFNVVGERMRLRSSRRSSAW